jgi:hypothetical protein
VLWEVFKRHYGAGGDPLILVAHGATRNPQSFIAAARGRPRA